MCKRRGAMEDQEGSIRGNSEGRPKARLRKASFEKVNNVSARSELDRKEVQLYNMSIYSWRYETT